MGLKILGIDIAMVFFDGAVTDAKAKTSPLPHWLGGVERIESTSSRR